MVNTIGNRLPRWKRNLLSHPGRELLIKIVFMAMPIYFMTIFKLPTWAIRSINRLCRSFFWKGRDPENVRTGHSLINWSTCTRPKKLGGLGFKDLDKFGRALRLRWLWHAWDKKAKPWKRLLKITDKVDRQLLLLHRSHHWQWKQHAILGGEMASWSCS